MTVELDAGFMCKESWRQIDAEGRNHLGLDEGQYILQDLASILLGEGDSFFKRYLARDLAFHAHFTLKSRKPPNEHLGDYCAIFEWPSAELLRPYNLEGAVKVLQDGYCSNWIPEKLEVTVLVNIAEFVKHPEWMQFGVLPCFVRLQALNDCLGCWVNKTDFVQATPTFRDAVLIGISE